MEKDKPKKQEKKIQEEYKASNAEQGSSMPLYPVFKRYPQSSQVHHMQSTDF